MKYLLTSVLILIGVASTVAVGQVIYNNASTAGESYARGVSGIIQAQGQRNLDNSQAAINAEDAYSAAIDNSVKSVNAYWEKKDIYSQHQQAQLAEIEQKRQRYQAKHGMTALTPQEFDRTTGAITWPKVLEQSQYDQYRDTLDKTFKDRSYNGALTGDEYMEATSASKQWRDMLNQQRDVYPGPILSQMIRFILKLNRELDDNLS
jgi:hypothetical protein